MWCNDYIISLSYQAVFVKHEFLMFSQQMINKNAWKLFAHRGQYCNCTTKMCNIYFLPIYRLQSCIKWVFGATLRKSTQLLTVFRLFSTQKLLFPHLSYFAVKIWSFFYDLERSSDREQFLLVLALAVERVKSNALALLTRCIRSTSGLRRYHITEKRKKEHTAAIKPPVCPYGSSYVIISPVWFSFVLVHSGACESRFCLSVGAGSSWSALAAAPIAA